MRARLLCAATLALLISPAQADPLADAAAKQVGVTVLYDPSYQGLSFPGGDIPRDRGVCTDVVIRALRDAHDIDLQVAVNRDMKAAFSAYPAIWGLSTTDRNIDHRRVPNLETLLERIGAARPPSDNPDDFAPGDIVSWRLVGSNLPHIGIVSTQRNADGTRPLVTHNIGQGTRTEDILFVHQMVMRARLDDAARSRLRRLSE
ncbi:MAG: DUF1287 domain-containing protein [Pseudomonadota bacterium]